MAIAHYAYPALDCPDPLALARFYGGISGFAVHVAWEEDGVPTWVELLDGDTIKVAFQRVEKFLKPTWPEGPVPQQAHLDFFVTDLDAAEKAILNIGAVKSPVQTSINPEEHFRVYFDPAGHPFCMVHVNELPKSN